MIALYIIASFCYIFLSNKWQTSLSFLTILVVISSLVVFFIGEIVSNKFVIIKYNNKNRKITTNDLKQFNTALYIRPSVFLIFLVVGIASLIGRFKYAWDLAIYAGNEDGLYRMLNFVYYAKYHLPNIPEESQFITFGVVITECFAIICLFIFMSRKHGGIKKIPYLIPLCVYSCQAALNGGRTWILRLIITILTLALYFMFIRGGNKKTFSKIIKLVLIFAVLFFVGYRLYGIARQSFKVDYETILAYPASPLEALNRYLENPKYSSGFGDETLVTIKGILNKLGFNFKVNSIALEMVYWEGYETNIYTSVRRYIADFGFFFMFIIQFLIGFFYGYLNKILRKTDSIPFVLFYSVIMYPVIESIFEERFFLGLLSAGTIYVLVGFLLLFRIVHSKKVTTIDPLRNKFKESVYINSSVLSEE